MNITSLNKIKEECRLFLNKVNAARVRLEKEDLFYNKETGACRRASMELTRALTEFRKP